MPSTKTELDLKKQKLTAPNIHLKDIERLEKQRTQPTDSSASPSPLAGTSGQSKSLSTNVAEHLLHLMIQVTEGNVNPNTVNAACNCATQMINLMKINIKLKDI